MNKAGEINSHPVRFSCFSKELVFMLKIHSLMFNKVRVSLAASFMAASGVLLPVNAALK
jgi:hypothetical protein